MAAKHVPQDQYHIEDCARFCVEVEKLVTESNKKADEREKVTGHPTLRLSYIEAVLVVAEQRKIELDYAAEYLNPAIKDKLRTEYESRHMLARSAKLPF